MPSTLLQKNLPNNFYLDYNATAPLLDSVRDWVAGARFTNPSSVHSLAKKDHYFFTRELPAFFYEFFSLDPKDYALVFHSGSTEALNALFRGVKFDLFICAEIDHSVSQALAQRSKNHEYYRLPLETRHYSWQKNQKIYLNFLPLQSEFGILSPWEEVEEIKKNYPESFVHIDASQVVGKIKDFQQLPSSFDAITFSGHKFGALPGVGFSFINKKWKISSWQEGGEQQEYRSGTLNTYGIGSLVPALKEYAQSNHEQNISFREQLIQTIKSCDQRFLIVGEEFPRANNTIFFLHPAIKADILLNALDVRGFYLGLGSACRGKSLQPHKNLFHLLKPSLAQQGGLRLSFNPLLTKKSFLELQRALEHHLSAILTLLK